MASSFLVQVINRHRLTVDGKGVTTLVGLFGCPLKCKYCINMDVLSNNKFKKMTPESLWEELSIDYCYYVASGGGITFGGGESLLHSLAIQEFIKIIPEGVTVNLETSLNAPISDNLFLETVNAVLDTGGELIIDTKSLDKDVYESYTGLDNARVNRRLKLLIEKGYQDKCTVRVPVIPKFKDEKTAKEEAEALKQMGFSNIDVFDYILRDYMNK